ncbi:MAG: hypothetical protein J6V15_04655, partial [Clostridia bacterium]|nr:hypothetical protein [Clostridia bacterium]
MSAINIFFVRFYHPAGEGEQTLFLYTLKLIYYNLFEVIIMDKMLETKIDAFLAENRDNIINDIIKMSCVPAVKGEAEEGAPFGKGPAQALEIAAQVARDMGFETTVYKD